MTGNELPCHRSEIAQSRPPEGLAPDGCRTTLPRPRYSGGEGRGEGVRATRLILAGLLALAMTPAAQAQRNLTEIPPPDPEIERQSFQVAEGFEVNLFASDPALAKPIQMNFDAQGRLWVVSSEVYPQILPGQVANDRVLVLEDADGDGTSDKTHVFADGLLIPTGIEPGDGGAYVANSTELVHYRDADGDLKADERRVVLSGFGTEDTHHILHTFRWGPEGLLYFNQSIYIHSHIETPHGVRRLGGGGVWQFRPETLELEVFIRGLCNPWGHHFDRYGQSFGTDGAGGEGINHFIPGGWYFTAPGGARIFRGLNAGSPKHCGLEVVGGSHLPADWQGSLLTNDFRANRVCRFTLSDDGSGYASREEPELIRTQHVGFRPVDIKQGPDGAIYIADWYNPIIQHGEVDFRDPRRDHTHGRIWRVTARGRPLVPRPDLLSMSNRRLLDELRSPEPWNRHFAKRVLKERGPSVAGDLAAWLAELDQAGPPPETLLLEALWVHQALLLDHRALVARLLAAADPGVRAAAVRVVSQTQLGDPATPERLAALVRDPHPRVRVEALRALGRLPSLASFEAALAAFELPIDRAIDYALWLTCRELESAWLPILERGELPVAGREKQMIFALGAISPRGPVNWLLDSLKSGTVPPDWEQSALDLLARNSGALELGRAMELVLGKELPAERRARLLTALVGASQGQRRLVPTGDLSRLSELLQVEDLGLRVAAVQAIGAWRVQALRGALSSLAAAADTPPSLVGAAIDGLSTVGGDESRALLKSLAGAGKPVAVRERAIAAITESDLASASKLAVALWNEEQVHDPAPVLNPILQRQSGAKSLTTALAQREIRPDVAKLALRIVRSHPGDQAALLDALRAAGGLGAEQKPLDPADLPNFVRQVAEQGDPARGEAVFRRADQACLKCHSIAGAGGRVGPDLISIGATAQLDYLLESVLVPSKAVKENYHATVVSTDDGRVISGIPVRETETELVVRDFEDRELTVAKATIEERTTGPSLMPAGLVDELTRQEVVDLTRFLSELGKVGPYSVGQARVVRRWRRLAPTPAAAELLASTSLDSAATDAPSTTAEQTEPLVWEPWYSQVNGELPLAEWGRLETRPDFPPAGFARFELEVTTAGPVALRFAPPTGLLLWVDGQGLAVQDETRLELAVGRHTCTLGVKLDERREPVRVELVDVPGSPARVEIVTGK